MADKEINKDFMDAKKRYGSLDQLHTLCYKMETAEGEQQKEYMDRVLFMVSYLCTSHDLVLKPGV